MANGKLVGYFQNFPNQSITGMVEMRRPGLAECGLIYFLAGKVVHARTDDCENQAAVFLMLSWEDADVFWYPNHQFDRISCHEDADILLFEYGQLEEGFQELEGLREFVRDKHREILKGQGDGCDVLPNLDNYRVRVEATAGREVSFELKQGCHVVGTDEAICDVVISHGSISRLHCAISVGKDRIEVVDLGSTNGTFVRDHLVRRDYLGAGDSLSFGQADFKVRLEALQQGVETVSQPAEIKDSGAPKAPKMIRKAVAVEPVAPETSMPKEVKASGMTKGLKKAPKLKKAPGAKVDGFKSMENLPPAKSDVDPTGSDTTKVVHWKTLSKKGGEKPKGGKQALNWRLMRGL